VFVDIFLKDACFFLNIQLKECKKTGTFGKYIGKVTHVEKIGGETPKKETTCKT
jgi:hypothetical protein